MDLYINGVIVKVGDKIKSFRNEVWTYLGVTRAPEPGKRGKVYAKLGDWQQEFKVYAKLGDWQQEFYPSVFGGVIRTLLIAGLATLAACGGTPPSQPKTCEARGLSTRSDGQCYYAAAPNVIPAEPAKPTREFVNDCAYQTKRLLAERELYESSQRSPRATLRYLSVLSDQKKACN